MRYRSIDALACASEHDPALKLPARLTARFRDKRVRSEIYDRNRLFSKMARGRPALFRDYPAPVHKGLDDGTAERLCGALRRARSPQTFPVRTGQSRTRKYYTLSEIMHRWDRDRSLLGVTDLHFRNTAFEKVVDPSRLTPFNLLERADGEIARLEMMTAVISTTNSWTDSHSDDPDGTNHCFCGRKLWLLWDTDEGLRAGLDDAQREKLPYKLSKFDMESFVGLKSSRWLLMEPGYTIFLPGSYTHRVFTLERYIGVGTFYVSLPNCLRTLSRWILRRPMWEIHENLNQVSSLVADIGHFTADTIRALQIGRTREQRTLGYDFLDYSIRQWRRSFSAQDRAILLESDEFQELAAAALGAEFRH